MRSCPSRSCKPTLIATSARRSSLTGSMGEGMRGDAVMWNRPVVELEANIVRLARDGSAASHRPVFTVSALFAHYQRATPPDKADAPNPDSRSRRSKPQFDRQPRRVGPEFDPCPMKADARRHQAEPQTVSRRIAGLFETIEALEDML